MLWFGAAVFSLEPISKLHVMICSLYCSSFWQLCFGMEVDMDGSSGDEGGLRSGLRRGTEISSIDEGELDGSRSSDEQSPGSLLRRGIKFSSVDEFLNFLKEGEVSDECSISGEW